MDSIQHYLSEASGDFDTFKQSVEKTTVDADYPQASGVSQNALIYSHATVLEAFENSNSKQALMSEWIKAWLDGPGVLMISGAMDHPTIDRANEIFEEIIQAQKDSDHGGGDHFAKAGSNDRIWNSLEKHCIADPLNFSRYYANETIALASEAWLGTGYQITAQVNRVNPGGAAQSAHRDYHLGFMSKEQIVKYPLHIHRLSPLLTLQGAIAHCDMPLESGPTLYLPYSQTYPQGYLAFNRDEFQVYFNEHRSQLALNKGDMVFFNPALMHAAGANATKDTYRLANLLQVSSAFGRPIESVNHQKITSAVYPTLYESKKTNSLSTVQLNNVVCACTDGYPFPTNLDTDLPDNGLAPRSQRQITTDALIADAEHQILIKQLKDHSSRRQAHSA